MTRLLPRPASKFFREVNGKYDARYFRVEVPPPEAIARLTDALGAFMAFCATNRVRPMLGHGTLMGWWWSRRVLPWDEDIDLLIAYPELFDIAAHGGHQLLDRRYLFEVNPNHVERRTRNRTFRQHREPNRIDARVIDTLNGLYIDVTALHAVRGSRLATKCPHVFPRDWLFPLRRDTLAGIPVFVPNRVEDVLTAEYGPEVLRRTRFHDHVFDRLTRVWRPDVA